MRKSIALLAAAALANAAIAAAAPEGAEPRGEAHFVPMDELSVPIVDGARADGTLRVKLVLDMADAAAAEEAGARLPALRANALAAAMEFARLYASPMTPVNVDRLASGMTTALRRGDGRVARVLVVEVEASRA